MILLPHLLLATSLSLVVHGADPTSVPPPPTGFENVVVDWSSPNITWVDDWNIGPSSCTPGATAISVSGAARNYTRLSFSYRFLGTSIYASFAWKNAEYSVAVDGTGPLPYNGDGMNSPAPDNCTFGFQMQNLSGDWHYLWVKALGPSTFEEPWALEMQNLVVTQNSEQEKYDGNSGAGGNTKASGSAARNGVHSLLVVAFHMLTAMGLRLSGNALHRGFQWSA